MSNDFLNKIKNELNENVRRLERNWEETKITEPEYKRFILYVDGIASGICGICKSREEKYPDIGELCNIYLLNSIKHMGYGRLLFEFAKNELKKMNYTSMVVFCIKDNPTTQFYEYMGGKLIYEKERNIGGKDLIENVYYYEKI